MVGHGLSKSIDQQDSDVTNTIAQSRYVISPMKSLNYALMYRVFQSRRIRRKDLISSHPRTENGRKGVTTLVVMEDKDRGLRSLHIESGILSGVVI